MPSTIHRTAEISPDAKIGDGTKIWNNAQVLAGAVIGENCVIGHNCLVGKATVGNGVKIQSNTDVWEGVVLEDFVFVGPSAVFTNDPHPRAKYPKKDFPAYGVWKPTLVKEGATIGANATIVCGVTIGKNAFIAAGAVVADDVPDYGLAMGVPARPAGWMCECGNKLVFKNGEAACLACGQRYSKKGTNIAPVR
ncbi:MAG: acyltransferase [Minisyncoccales bacterium]